MTKYPKDKIIKARTIQIIALLVIGVLCGATLYSVITVYKNSLTIDALKEIKNDIKIIEENMVIIGEKAGMTPNELTDLVSRLQGEEIERKQLIKRKGVSQQKIITSSTMINNSNPHEKVESSKASLLRERLKSYEVLLEKSEGSSELKMVEEATEPIPEKAPEEALHIPQVNNIRKETQKSITATKTIQKYHIVKKGETLSHIARKYNISIQELGKLNNIDLSHLIYPGQKLIIYKDSKK